MTTLTATLQSDHRNFSRLLDILLGEARKFSKAEEPDYDLIEKAIDYFQHYPDIWHHPVESLIYGRLAERDPVLVEILGDLDAEHQKLNRLIKRFSRTVEEVLLDAELPRSELLNAVEAFCDFFRSHMLLEELRFLPAANKLLKDDDWAWIEAELENEADPLFGRTVMENYRQLREEIDRIALEAAA